MLFRVHVRHGQKFLFNADFGDREGNGLVKLSFKILRNKRLVGDLVFNDDLVRDLDAVFVVRENEFTQRVRRRERAALEREVLSADHTPAPYQKDIYRGEHAVRGVGDNVRRNKAVYRGDAL